MGVLIADERRLWRGLIPPYRMLDPGLRHAEALLATTLADACAAPPDEPAAAHRLNAAPMSTGATRQLVSRHCNSSASRTVAHHRCQSRSARRGTCRANSFRLGPGRPATECRAAAVQSARSTDWGPAFIADLLQTAQHRPGSRILDFTQPVAVPFMGVLGHVSDDDQARSIVRTLMNAVPSGSYFASFDSTNTSREVVMAADIWNQSANPTYHLRSPERIVRFFDGLELVEPGVVSVTRWRPDPSMADVPAEIDQYCGVARKP